jgi:enoyl reductase
VTSATRILTVLLAAASLALVPGTAYAGKGGGGTVQNGGQPPKQEGGVDGDTLSATAGGVSYDKSHNGSGPSVGQLASVTNWSPPPCWYTPTWTPQQFKDYVEPIWAVDSTGAEWDASQEDRYVKGNPYTNFNLDKTGKGYWWNSYVPDGGAAVPGALDCNEPYFWVDTGAAPPANIKNALTPEILSQLAYERIRVPDTDINLNPAGGQTVNLSTWAWLDKATFKPVSVTATADLLGIWATTTATPVALHLDPGTPDADVYPASGNCPINPDGSIGTPYVKGSGNAAPPCGVVYRRATPDGDTYPLRATITWSVSWTGSGGTGGDLPEGTFGHTTALTVQEIQTVNR